MTRPGRTDRSRGRHAGGPVRPSGALALALLCGLLVACGGGDESGGDGSDGADQRASVERVVNLFADSEPEVCDHVSDAFLTRYFEGRREQCRRSAREDPSKGSRATDVTIDGGRASAMVRRGGSQVRVGLVVRDGDWLVDKVRQAGPAREPDQAKDPKAKAKRTPKTARRKAPVEGDKEGDESAARGGVEAFLQAIEEDDEAVLCGLLSERYARRLVRVSKDGIAKCVSALKGQSLGVLRKRFGESKVSKVELLGKRRADVILENGITIELSKTGSRYVIEGVDGAD